MRKVYIEQAVFGYADRGGHHCLAHSFPFRDYSDPMPIMQADRSTDLTGYMPEGTKLDTWHSRGFPIDGWYVLCRTWHDIEGKAIGLRSGCCWTHAVFVPLKIIHELQNYLWLGNLFKRPVRGEYEDYRKPFHIDWPVLPVSVEYPEGQREAFTGEFASLITRQKDCPIVWSKSETAEHMCSFLWRIAKPEKLSSFAFHSGAVGMCYNGKREYDLVCMAATTEPDRMIGNFYHERHKKWVIG